MIADLVLLAWRFVVVMAAFFGPFIGALFVVWDAKGQPGGRFVPWLVARVRG